jgi:hypothetical protein
MHLPAAHAGGAAGSLQTPGTDEVARRQAAVPVIHGLFEGMETPPHPNHRLCRAPHRGGEVGSKYVSE